MASERQGLLTICRQFDIKQVLLGICHQFAVRLCQQDLLTICRQFVVKSCQQALLGFCYQFALRFCQQDLPAKHERIADILDANLLPSFDQICRQFVGNLRANCLLGIFVKRF